jgi:hypothetical protein
MQFRGIELFLRHKAGEWLVTAKSGEIELVRSAKSFYDVLFFIKRDLLWYEAMSCSEPCGIVEIQGEGSGWSLKPVYLNGPARNGGELPLSMTLGLPHQNYWPMLQSQGFYQILLGDRLFSAELIDCFPVHWAIERFGFSPTVPRHFSVPGPAQSVRGLGS